MERERVLRLVAFTLNDFADRFQHTNICDHWEDYYSDCTHEERDEARRIVEFMEGYSDEMAAFLMDLYAKEGGE